MDRGLNIADAGVIAIVRAAGGIDLVRLAEALVAGGVRALEITLNTPGALAAVAAIRQRVAGQCLIGTGTIRNSNDARRAIDAGSQFIVTPTLQPDSIELCRMSQVPIICGCTTPTEMLTAHRNGADLIKLFPAHRFGPQYVRDVLAPMPFLRIVPTGGVTTRNIGDYLSAGAVAVGVGGGFVDPAVLNAGRWDEVSARARAMVEAFERATNVAPKPDVGRAIP